MNDSSERIPARAVAWPLSSERTIILAPGGIVFGDSEVYRLKQFREQGTSEWHRLHRAVIQGSVRSYKKHPWLREERRLFDVNRGLSARRRDIEPPLAGHGEW